MRGRRAQILLKSKLKIKQKQTETAHSVRIKLSQRYSSDAGSRAKNASQRKMADERLPECEMCRYICMCCTFQWQKQLWPAFFAAIFAFYSQNSLLTFVLCTFISPFFAAHTHTHFVVRLCLGPHIEHICLFFHCDLLPVCVAFFLQFLHLACALIGGGHVCSLALHSMALRSTELAEYHGISHHRVMFAFCNC